MNDCDLDRFPDFDKTGIGSEDNPSYAYAVLASSKPYINKLSRELLIYTLCNNLLCLGDCFNGFG
jgi:hypothetical protein